MASELAIATALKPAHFAALKIGQDIICRPGKLALYRWFNPPVELDEAELPDTTTALLDLYRAAARSRLQLECASHLFPGAPYRSKHPIVLSRQIATLMERECDVRITASQIKWVIAVLILKRDPEDWESVRDVLGYKTVEAVQNALRVFVELGVFSRFDKAVCRAA